MKRIFHLLYCSSPIFIEDGEGGSGLLLQLVEPHALTLMVNKEDNSAVVEASNPTVKDKPSSLAAVTTSPILTNLPSASKKRKGKSRIKKIKIKKNYKGDYATTLALSIEPSSDSTQEVKELEDADEKTLAKRQKSHKAKAQSLELISSVFVVENLETKDNLENYVSLAAAFPQQGEMTAAFPPPPPEDIGVPNSSPMDNRSPSKVVISSPKAIPTITLPTSSSHVRTITDEVPEAYMP
ncbi:hypothetical protein ACFE04_020636 [Oxalis oulophora]